MTGELLGDVLQRFTLNLHDLVHINEEYAGAAERFGRFEDWLAQRDAATPTFGSWWARARAEAAGPGTVAHPYALEAALVDTVSKDDLRTRPNDFRTSEVRERPTWSRPTSGSTGPRLVIHYSRSFYTDLLIFSDRRIARLGGVPPRVAAREASVFSVAIIDQKDATERVWMTPEEHPSLTLQVVYDERSPGAPHDLVNVLDRYKPELLSVKPNILESFLGGLRHHGIRPRHRPAMVVSSGSVLDDVLRLDCREMLGVDPCDAYGLTEFGLVASQCAARDRLHVLPGAFAEVLSPAGEPTASGAGELVLSSLANSAMPLLRYRTGDVAELVTEPCPCGTEGQQLRMTRARRLRNLPLADGTFYSPANVHTLLAGHSLDSFAVDYSQTGMHLRLDVPTSQRSPALAARIRDQLLAEVSSQIAVSVSYADLPFDDDYVRFREIATD